MKKFSFKRLSKKQKIITGIAVLLVLVGGFAVYKAMNKDTEAKTEAPKKFYSLITGVETSEEESKRQVLAVMIENSELARPQTGVGSAGMVFESVTEGGITRYLTMFQENQPEIVGPVRSVRSYFVSWLTGFDAAVAHVGGSADALELIKKIDTKDLSQFTYPEPYYRVSNREAPHNMYATTQKLRDLEDKLGFNSSTFDEIPRSSDAPAQTPVAPKIAVNYSMPVFAVEFRYDAMSNSYLRFLAGKADKDAVTKKQIAPKNVVAIKMSGSTVNALGSGQAVVFKDGNALKATWKQPSHKERIKLFDETGKEIPLNRGSTWFTVIPSSGNLSY